MSDATPSRSVHGGTLAVDDRVLRAQLADQLFGKRSVVKIGRFVVKRLIGAGGMGQVFEAEDPQLDRTVAVKVVRQLGTGDPGRARARMEREAKAQAQLNSPHVVTVYEVGAFEDGLYIAMELVTGSTLRAWLAQTQRPAAEVVDVFIQAGRGLAAAHRRGLVHRDFKADNVLIDAEDGRARVTDFGLVQVGEAVPPAAGPATAPEGSRSTAGTGTPQYMSPEQRSGGLVDGRSDQYSFCVAVQEALGAASPPRISRVVARGRSEAPEDRYPDMEALLLALARASRPRWALWVGGAALALGGVAIAAWPASVDCSDAGDLSGVWDEAVRADASAAVGTAEASYVSGAWPATMRALDDYAAQWRQHSQRACELGEVRSAELGARSADCLDTRRDDLAFVTSGLVRGDADVVATALHLATGLASTAACNDEARLNTWTLPEDTASADAREVSRQALRDAALQLATARTRESGGDLQARLAAATHSAEAARVGAERLGDVALEARALYVLGQLAQHRGDPAEAEALLGRSAARAEAARDDRTRVRALSFQVFAIGTNPERLGEVLQVAAQADAVLETLGDPPLLRAQLASNLGTAKAKARPPDAQGAIADLRRALALLTETVGEDHPDVLSARVNLGNTLGRVGDAEASRAVLAEAVEAAPRVWGAEHPLTATVEGTFGMALLRTGDVSGARARLEGALRKSEAALGAEHQQVADARYNLALVLQRQGEHALAVEQLRQGLETTRRLRGERSGSLIAWHYALGKSELASGQLDAAERTLGQALALCEEDGAPARDFARVRFLLAKAIAPRDPAHARFLAERARQTWRSQGKAARVESVESFLAELPGPGSGGRAQNATSSRDRGATSKPL